MWKKRPGPDNITEYKCLIQTLIARGFLFKSHIKTPLGEAVGKSQCNLPLQKHGYTLAAVGKKKM